MPICFLFSLVEFIEKLINLSISGMTSLAIRFDHIKIMIVKSKVMINKHLKPVNNY